MIEAWAAEGREVAVIGLGRSGTAATLLLLDRGVRVYASDAGTSDALSATGSALQAAGAEVDLGRHDLARIRAAGAAILSPGIPPDAPPVAAARDAGYPVRAEIDLGLEALGGVRYVGITGTNGKSTVTALTAHLLHAAGRHAEAAGNIGLPLCEIATWDRPPAWLAIEFSSFQLHDCRLVNPDVGILTNLAPDHLDRYPDLDAYYADKGRLFANAHPGSCWVTNADDLPSQRLVEGVPGRHLRFSLAGRADGWLDRTAARLMLGDQVLLDRADLPLLGEHNIANALAAALALEATGGQIDALAAGLRTFRGLPHRLEPIMTVDQVLWINDSKATNVASTAMAVAAMDRPFVLLLGGRHKGEPYTSLLPHLTTRVRAVVAYGESRRLVVQDLGTGVPVVEAGGFEEVLTTAARLAKPGDVVLLSPACSSYDMFRNYEERGHRFRAWVEAR